MNPYHSIFRLTIMDYLIITNINSMVSINISSDKEMISQFILSFSLFSK